MYIKATCVHTTALGCIPQKVPLPYESIMAAGPTHCYWGKLGSHYRKMITACWTEIILQKHP